MAPASNENKINLAMQAMQNSHKLSIRRASRLYNAPYSTLRDRIHGVPTKSNTRSPTQKLTEFEEQTIVQYILELDSRSFPPRC
jgi:CMP-N-acetylneuraminic acid synthetase